MTKAHTISTFFGEPLSAESKKLLQDVRLRITQPLGDKFNTDFNLYRFIMNAERAYKNRKDIVEFAAKAINLHLRLRKCLKLDELRDIPFQENLIFKQRFLPCGEIQSATDCFNRLLWFIEYATISVEGIAHGMKSSEAIRYQFWQFEYMLRKVNHQEQKSGCLSSLRHIIDMNGYEINPFTMLFVSTGSLSYYSQLFHYENYPELVNPIEMVNIAKWIHVPYKLIKTMMPAGFSDRFRLHDGNFIQYLTSEMSASDIPSTLGGDNKDIICIPAEKLSPSEYWQVTDENLPKDLEVVTISPRKSKQYRIETEKEMLLSWYFQTDGDVYFGVFYEALSTRSLSAGGEKEIDLVMNAEMIYPWMKLSAKLYHEFDAIVLPNAGIYHILFCNKHSWLQRRTVDVTMRLTDPETNATKRYFQDGRQVDLIALSSEESHFLDAKAILKENNDRYNGLI